MGGAGGRPPKLLKSPLWVFRGELLLKGSGIEWGSIQETLAYNAWCRERTLMLRALKALIYAPSDAVSDGVTKRPSAIEFESFARELWPEIETVSKQALERQRAAIDRWRDRPIELRVRGGLDDSMDVSMGNPLE